MSVRLFLHYLYRTSFFMRTLSPGYRVLEHVRRSITRQERDHYNLNIRSIILCAANEIATDGNCKTTTQERFWMLIKRHLRNHCRFSDYIVLC